MNREALHRIIKGGESQTVDFKKIVTTASKIAKTIVAFANAQGGKILIGVADNKKITGIDPEEEKYILQEAALHHCDPPVALTFSEVEEDGLTVLIAEVPESRFKPHFTVDDRGRRQLYVRVADKNMAGD